MRRVIAALFLIIYLGVLFHLTLFRFHTRHANRNLVPFRTIEHDLRAGGWEFVINVPGNLLAFVPMGLLPPLLLARRCSWRTVAALSFALSLLIESIQGISGHRVADVDDLLLNTVGGLIGLGIGNAGRWARERLRRNGQKA